MTTTVRERPILFSDPMVSAILADQKTQTRRPVKGPLDFHGPGGKHGDPWDDPTCWGWEDEAGDFHTLMPDKESSCNDSCVIPCPYGRPGDYLWVRERAWFPPPITRAMLREGADTWPKVIYGDREADWCREQGWGRFPPGRMPRRLARLRLENTDVRVERVDGVWEWVVSVRRIEAEGGEPS